MASYRHKGYWRKERDVDPALSFPSPTYRPETVLSEYSIMVIPTNKDHEFVKRNQQKALNLGAKLAPHAFHPTCNICIVNSGALQYPHDRYLSTDIPKFGVSNYISCSQKAENTTTEILVHFGLKINTPSHRIFPGMVPRAGCGIRVLVHESWLDICQAAGRPVFEDYCGGAEIRIRPEPVIRRPTPAIAAKILPPSLPTRPLGVPMPERDRRPLPTVVSVPMRTIPNLFPGPTLSAAEGIAGDKSVAPSAPTTTPDATDKLASPILHLTSHRTENSSDNQENILPTNTQPQTPKGSQQRVLPPTPVSAGAKVNTVYGQSNRQSRPAGPTDEPSDATTVRNVDGPDDYETADAANEDSPRKRTRSGTAQPSAQSTSSINAETTGTASEEVSNEVLERRALRVRTKLNGRMKARELVPLSDRAQYKKLEDHVVSLIRSGEINHLSLLEVLKGIPKSPEDNVSYEKLFTLYGPILVLSIRGLRSMWGVSWRFAIELDS